MAKGIYYILIFITVVFSVGTLMQLAFSIIQEPYISTSRKGDAYDPTLVRLNNISALEIFIDSIAASKGIDTDSIPDYVNLADSVLRLRFYHGLQNYRFAENFIANLLGKYVWSHMGAKVIPDHILRGQKAFCSQSSIVFQEFLKRKGFDVRSVHMPGHFCTEVMVNGNWQFHDVSYKPSFSGMPSLSTQDLIDFPHYTHQAYLYSFAEEFRDNIQLFLDPDKLSYGPVNAFAAPNMDILHRVTGFFSLWGWLVFLLLTIVWQRIFISRSRINS